MMDSGNPRRYMIAAFDGWNDACTAATNVIRHLLNIYPSREVGHICCDNYYDFQVNRPVMCVVQGRKQVMWPETTIYELTLDVSAVSGDTGDVGEHNDVSQHAAYAEDSLPQPDYSVESERNRSVNPENTVDNDTASTLQALSHLGVHPGYQHTAPTKLYVAMGPEPNFHWSDFCQRLMHLADECDVTDIITLGSMFAEVPHTRALPIYMSEGDDDVADDNAYTGPIGIPTVLSIAAAEDGFDAHSLWVAVPQYLGQDDCPAGTLRLLEEISALTDLDLDEAELPDRAESWRRIGNMVTMRSDKLSDYVHALERNADNNTTPAPSVSAPYAKRLVEETEEFLRSFDHPAAE